MPSLTLHFDTLQICSKDWLLKTECCVTYGLKMFVGFDVLFGFDLVVFLIFQIRYGFCFQPYCMYWLVSIGQFLGYVMHFVFCHISDFCVDCTVSS